MENLITFKSLSRFIAVVPAIANVRAGSFAKMAQWAIFLTLCPLLPTEQAEAQATRWTLEEAVNYAREHNITVRQSELDLELANLARRDAAGNLLPSLNSTSNFGVSSGYSINPITNVFESVTFSNFTFQVTSGLTLFDGLRNIRELQQAKLAEVAGQYNLEKMKDDIALMVANAYLETLFNRENLKVLKAQNEVTKEQLERTGHLVDAGTLPRGELLEIQSIDAGEQQRIITAENMLQLSLINLAQLLLVKDYENFEIADTEYEAELSELLNRPAREIIEKAREVRYETRLAEQNLLQAEKNLQISRGAYYPTLNAFLGVDTRWSDADVFNRDFWTQIDDNRGLGYGLSLNIPIFNGLSVRNNVKRSLINIEKAELDKEQVYLDMEATVYQAYTDAKGALKAYEAAQLAEEARLLTYEYAQERFDVGLMNSLGFSQAKFQLEEAQAEVIRAKYDYIFKLKILEFYFGLPIY